MDGENDLKVENSEGNTTPSMVKITPIEANANPKKFKSWLSDDVKPQRRAISVMNNENGISLNLLPGNFNFHFSQHVPELKKRQNQSTKKIVNLKKNLVTQFEKYCKISTLHGLRYVGDSQFSIGARIFWCVAFSLAIGFASYFISNIYSKWKTSPVIISYNPFDSDINSIPFPAVTICNMNQAKRDEATKILKEGSILEKKLLDDTCDGNTTFNDDENVSWEILRDFLIRVGNSCSDVLRVCRWAGEKVNCNEYFDNELTDEGLCCSFNRLPPKTIFRNWKEINILNQSYTDQVVDWNPEQGFTDDDDDNYVPRRSLGAGPRMGLSVTVDAEVDNYYCSSTRSTGFKVILSSPRESPKVADFGFLVGTGFENNIFIGPLVRQATYSLRSVPIQKRQCYFTNERPLEYYRAYTQRNCLLECQSKHTFNMCQCVPYYLPKNKTIKYCSKTRKDCVDNAKIHMETAAGRSNCHCLPACFSVKYPYGKSMSYLYKSTYADLLNTTAKYFRNNMVVMHFYFQSTTFTSELKSELFGSTENLSNIGGLLSLFLGFSFLGLMELVYFVSLRVLCDIAKHRKIQGRANKRKVISKF